MSQVQLRAMAIMDAYALIASDVDVSPFGTSDGAIESDGSVEESSDLEESNDENPEEEPSHPPMLRWTTRLRDFLGKRGYEIEAGSLPKLREADFIPPPLPEADSQSKIKNAVLQGPDRKRKSIDGPHDNDKTDSAPIAFPQSFDFYLFWWCFNRSQHLQLHIYPRGTGIPPPDHDQQQQSRCKPVDWFREDVSLLWLSPSIFISTIELSWASAKTAKLTPLWLYTITFHVRHSCGCPDVGSFHIYCIEYFEKYKRHKPSPPRLPLALFHQMLSPLPVDCFVSVEFKRRAPIDCDFYSQLLSSIMPSAVDALPPLMTKNYQEYTEVRFSGKITDAELAAILDHPFHPYVRLVFDLFDETTLDRQEFNYMLRYSSDHVRHLKIPKFLITFDPSKLGDESFTANPRLETLTMDSWCGNMYVSPDLMRGIQRNPNFQRLALRFYVIISRIRDIERERRFPFTVQEKVALLLQEVIPSHPSFKELSVEAELISKVSDDINDEMTGRSIDHLLSSSESFPNTLTHLSFEWTGQSFEGGHKPEISSAVWDVQVAPHLAMNWLFHQSQAEQRHEVPTWARSKKASNRIKRTGAQPAASLLALQIRAINEGILYRKTTEHLPHNMSTANASVIAALLQLNRGEGIPIL
jgi:hypothetical protein